MKQYDCILSHGPEGSYVASFSGVPYVHIYHGNSNPMSISRFRIGKYFARMYEAMFRRIDETCPLVYTVGPARNSKQRKLYNPLVQKVKPIPTEERRGFIFAGRLEAMKNVDRLIRIYAKLPEEIRRENPLYIAGYGTQESALRELAEQVLGKIVFLGKVENSEMMQTDADKRILLMASSTEGMPTAIAEAFSVGVPVVSTAVGDIPSVMQSGKQGELLPLDFKDEEYIDAILRILNSYDVYAEAAYETSTLFDGEKITRGMIRDIQAMLKQ